MDKKSWQRNRNFKKNHRKILEMKIPRVKKKKIHWVIKTYRSVEIIQFEVQRRKKMFNE